jgi:thiosulfate/3-mercaptopyruvate sulfurtransferase
MRVSGAAALCALLVTSTAASAQAPGGASRDRLVVSQAWLAAHLRDPGLVVLQVGEKATYDKGHIPGARFADWMQFHTMNHAPGALTLEMPPAAQIHDALEALGVSDNSHVVIYASDGWWSPSTRMLLTLDYAGLSKVSYLDGGLKGWVASGQPLSTDVPLASKGTLAPLTLKPVIVDAAFVQAHQRKAGFAIVDARNTEFYDGTREGGQRGQTRRPGHIPGAVSAPYTSFASDDGQLKSNEEIAAVFTKAGIKPGDTVVAYCHIGQQATALVFAARVLGHNAVLYDGSFEDWNAKNLPLDVPRKDK